jgi:peptide/nickel transport system ATP-binding protein
MTTPSNQPPVLSIRNLWVEYQDAFRSTPAVRDLSLDIHQGAVYGLVGESGCGKSTVALACVRYLPTGTKTRGEILLQGENLFTMSDHRLRQIRGNRVAMVYQDPLSSLNPSMTVISQIEEILTVHEHASAQEARRRCLEVLERVRIADPVAVAWRYPHQLSGGMQQRVIIAMALLLKPALLIMDEPTTGLDVTIEAAVLDLVNDLRRETNTAILFISHNLGVIARLCEHVGVMYAGEMVEEAPVVDLFKAPRHPYTTGLLRCIPRKGANKTERPLWSIPGRVPALNELPNHCIFAARCSMVQSDCLRGPVALERFSATRRSRCLFWDEVSEEQLRSGEDATQAISLTSKRESKPGGLAVKELKVQFTVSESMLSLKMKKDTVKAVEGVSFDLPPRKTVGIVGESGCGKTTLARAIAGLTPISSGDVRLSNVSLNQPVGRRKKETLQMLQMVFQNPESTLNPQKTVEEELRRPLRLFQNTSRQEENRLIGQLLTAVNLDDSYRDRYPAQLSGGEKQRVAIARAFAGSPELVLCDEPTSALDVSVQSMVLNMLQRLQHDFGVSLLFISHDLGVVRYISDFIGVVYLGRLCEYGPVEQVFQPPYHPYTEALLSAIPVPDPTVRKERIHLEGSVPSSINPPKGCGFHTRCPRKLGAICEETPPPANSIGEHRIYCHIPREELLRLQEDYR